MTGDSNWDRLAPMIEEVIEQDRIGICISSIGGDVLYVNRPFLQIFGRENNDGQSIKKISDISKVLTDVMTVVKKEKTIRNRELSIKTKAKSEHILSCTACIHDSGGDENRSAVMIIRDVTGVTNRGTDDRWQAVLDSLEDGYYECDIGGNFVNVNRAFHRITEYTREEIIGNNYKIFYTPEDAEKIYRIYNDVFVNRKPSGMINFTALAKSGRKKDIESSISLIIDPNDRISGFRGIIRDVSEKKRIDKELLRARKLEAIGILSR